MKSELCIALAAAVTLVAAAPALAQSPAAAMPPAPANIDLLPDVSILGRQPTTPDVMTNRFSRFTKSRCFSADIYSAEPTLTFNRAYYAEMTGRDDYYDAIKPPPPTIRGKNKRPRLHGGGGGVFSNLDSPMAVPGNAPILALMGPAEIGASGGAGCTAPGVRAAAERNTTFARAVAAHDKGEDARALGLFKQAREELGPLGLGNEAALMIAKLYLEGRDVPRDPVLALYWLEKVVAFRPPYQGIAERARWDPANPDWFYRPESEAATMISGLYAKGDDGVRKSATQSRAWTETAVRTYHVPAVLTAAEMYRDGYGGPRSLKKALIYYDAAGWVGHAQARFIAAGMYARGEGTRKDPKKALNLYRQAALMGSPDAARTLAEVYQEGDGVLADLAVAMGFFKDAALKGDAKSQTVIAGYFYDGRLIEKDLDMARGWYEQAATRGDPEAMVRLAAMFENGEGGERDRIKAWAWLTLAQRAGHPAPGLAELDARLSPEELAAGRLLLEDAADGEP